MMKNNNECLLEMKKAGVRYDNRWLVRDIDLQLHRQEIVTLIGPNGSGKTTTAKMALNIISPSKGEIYRKPNVKFGYVPQKLSIDRSMPLQVEKLMRLTNRLDQKTLQSALNRVGMSRFIHAQVADLSGGELQRVLLARAIARQPDILVLDEPLQGVDFNGESELYALIGELKNELNCAILLISHDLHIVMAATDRVLCLNGHICCSGTPETVIASEAYGTLIGQNKAPLAVYQHHHDHSHGPDGNCSVPQHTEHKNIDHPGSHHA